MSDLIKREDAIKVVDSYVGTDPIVEKLKEVPSAEPKQGEWIRHENPRYFYDREQGDTNAGVYYTCSECNYISLTHNFCPNCGNYNGGEQK